MTEAFGKGYTPESMREMKDISESSKQYLGEVRAVALKFSGLADALEFRKEFESKAEKAFPLKCEKCGGTMLRKSGSGLDDKPGNPEEGSYDISSVSFKE